MKKEFYVHGMHCPACELLIEDKLSEAHGVTKVKANLKTARVTVSSKHEISPEDLSKLVEKHGYRISVEKEQLNNLDYKEMVFSFVISAIIFFLFLLLQKLGIVNLVNPKQITLPFVFLIGVIASLSTCMAVVGGLVLSISSNYAKEKNYKPLISFHVSRIIGFFILGGLIGVLGSAFILNPTAYFVMNTILFIVMIIMGLNLINIFSFTKRLQIRIPKSVGKHILSVQGKRGIIPAMILGVSTFVLPCGFTQSMQVYSLTTGNFIQGAIIMLVFALGTFPVLSLISFASFQIKSKMLFTTSGFLVLMFALLNFISGLRAIGIISF